MAMIMKRLVSCVTWAAGAPQRAFLGENVARSELTRAGVGEIFAHAGIGEGRDVPGPIEVSRRRKGPCRDVRQFALMSQVFCDRPEKPFVSGLASRRRLVRQHRALQLGR